MLAVVGMQQQASSLYARTEGIETIAIGRASRQQSAQASSLYARTEGIETVFRDFSTFSNLLMHHRCTPAPRALKQSLSGCNDRCTFMHHRCTPAPRALKRVNGTVRRHVGDRASSVYARTEGIETLSPLAEMDGFRGCG